MQYIKLKYQTDEVDLFSDDDMDGDIQPIPREDYERPVSYTHLDVYKRQDDLRVLAVFLADVNADLDMAALDLVVKGLADVMQQTSAAGQLDIDTQLTGHQTGQPGHLERVAQDVLAEARAVLQAANKLDKVRMQAVNAKLHDGLVAFALHLDFQLAAALVYGLLDAGRMDTTIGNQALQRHAGDLAAGLVLSLIHI